MSLKETILAAKDLPIHREPVPEWGVDVGIRRMTGKERDEFDLLLSDPARQEDDRLRDQRGIKGRLLILTLVDPDTEELIFEDNEDDLGALQGKAAEALGPLADIAMRVNGITTKDVDDLEKNSGADQSDKPG